LAETPTPIERLQFLLLLQEDFAVAKTNKATKRPGKWLQVSELKENPGNFSHRQQLGCEVIIELDKPTMDENKALYESIKPKLEANLKSWECWSTQSKSLHIHIFFNRVLTDAERLAWLKSVFSEEEIEAFDKAFWTTGTRHLVALGGAVHYKSGKPKVLVEAVGSGVNEFPAKLIGAKGESREKSRKVKEMASEILKMSDPNGVQRVSCIMQIFEAKKALGWNAERIARFVDVENKWVDYDPAFTRKKIETILEKYGKRENPVQAENIREVPTLEFVDLSYLDYLFKDTHSHLPAFDLIDAELGLQGEEYYTVKKFLAYFVESLKQNTVQFVVGNQFFDNRVHAVIFGATGTGKNRIKSLLKLHPLVTECSPDRTHIEQLIGKVVKTRSGEVEKRGYFDRKALIGDEAQKTLNEENANLASIMREFRGAMDIFGFNEVEKQLTGTGTMRYFPETRFLFLVHDVVLNPVFFDSGTYRRMFAFEIKPVAIPENAAVKNLYAQSRIREMKEYIRAESRYVDSVEFPKEAVDEVSEWVLVWNRFTQLNPKQRLRSVSKRAFFSCVTYFFKIVGILTLIKGEPTVSVETARQGCFDAMHFLLKTFELYANKGTVSLSRDVWKTDDFKEAMFLEWLHYNNATSFESSTISIARAQYEIGCIMGLTDRQSRSVFQKLKKNGFILAKKGRHESRVWLAFKPEVEGYVVFEDTTCPDLEAFLKKKKELIEKGQEGGV